MSDRRVTRWAGSVLVWIGVAGSLVGVVMLTERSLFERVLGWFALANGIAAIAIGWRNVKRH